MAIASADDVYRNAARQTVRWVKTSPPVSATSLIVSPWGSSPNAGTLAVGNTTTGVLFTDATAGGVAINSFGAGNKGYIKRVVASASGAHGRYTLYDRIWGAGAISATTLATTNFSSQPSITGRLPNGDDYGSLEIWLEFTTTFSATATTVSVGYTNEAGTAGRSTGASSSLSGFVNERIIRMPLQAGDKGIQKIDSVTVGGTVATAGAFNVLLVRPLVIGHVRAIGVASSGALESSAIDWELTGGVEVFDTSCLSAVLEVPTVVGTIALLITIING